MSDATTNGSSAPEARGRKLWVGGSPSRESSVKAHACGDQGGQVVKAGSEGMEGQVVGQVVKAGHMANEAAAARLQRREAVDGLRAER